MSEQLKNAEVSIKEVAEFARVHRTTASKVLNNDQSCKVAAGTRRRILKAAQHLGFNRNDRFISPQGAKNFGLLAMMFRYDKENNPFYSDVFDGIDDEARLQGLNVYLINKLEQTSLCHLLEQEEFLGMLRVGTLSQDLLVPFEMAGKPLVGVEAQHHISSSALYTVRTDSTAGTRKATEYLIKAGHRRIYYLGFGFKGKEDAGCFERFEGVASALKEAGLYHRHCRLVAEFEEKNSEVQAAEAMGRTAMLKFLEEEKPEFPFACVCYSDLHACGVYRAAKEKGLRIPEDISVVGYDDIARSKTMDPPLSSIHVPRVEMGRRAVQLFLQLEYETVNHETVLPSQLMVRESILHLC